nr:uncharacterized protein LOC129277545 [Lytechinus pictus]
MALLNGFLSRISSLVNQVARCLEQEQPSTETLRGFHNQLHSSLQQFSRIRGTIEDGEYTQLHDDLQELQSLTEQAIEKSRQRSGAYKPSTEQGRRGAPKYSITSEQLTLLLDANFTIVEIANILQVSVSTIERRMR